MQENGKTLVKKKKINKIKFYTRHSMNKTWFLIILFVSPYASCLFFQYLRYFFC